MPLNMSVAATTSPRSSPLRSKRSISSYSLAMRFAIDRTNPGCSSPLIDPATTCRVNVARPSKVVSVLIDKLCSMILPWRRRPRSRRNSHGLPRLPGSNSASRSCRRSISDVDRIAYIPKSDNLATRCFDRCMRMTTASCGGRCPGDPICSRQA